MWKGGHSLHGNGSPGSLSLEKMSLCTCFRCIFTEPLKAKRLVMSVGSKILSPDIFEGLRP